MGRSPRIEYYGAMYHIIQRGNNKDYIFENATDKMKLLNIIGEVKELFDFYLVAYCIMDNHYHLIIKTHNVPISKVMHRINTLYAIYYNYRHDRTGSPFEGRYKGILVHNEYYLFNLINYIHSNPVYKNMVKTMTEYKWSSDVFYRMNIESIVDIDYALDILSENRESAIIKYKELMNVYEDNYEKLKQEFESAKAIGCEDNDSTTPLKDRRLKMDQILKEICDNVTDYELIKIGSRKAYLMKYKYKFIEKCIDEGFTFFEIGQFICISERAVRKHMSIKVSSKTGV